MNLSRAFFVSNLYAAASASRNIRGSRAPSDDYATTRIIGGSEATEGRYSYAVSLQDDLGHFCGGSMIARDIVLSAAHCMRTDGGYNSDPGYSAVVGRHNLSMAEQGEEVVVKTEITHPDYDWDTTDNDFMILVLNRPIASGDVDLVAVSPDVVPVGSAVTVVGWGDTHPSDYEVTMPDELMETEVYVVSNEECDRSNGTVGATEANGTTTSGWLMDYHDQITGNMLCAKDVAAKDACQGDSGGPLVVRDASGDYQVGVVSWGISCAHDSFPGVYSRISAQYQWIREHVCNESSDPPASFECEGLVQASKTEEAAVEGGWTTIVEEDFANEFGLFGQTGNTATHYNEAMERTGVVRIANGAAGHSVLQSNLIPLQGVAYDRIRVSFSFYAIGMEESDDLCLHYELDDGAITGKKCWSSIHAFQLSTWYDGVSFEFGASDARTLKIAFEIEGDDTVDGVLIDSVAVQGQ